MQYTLKQQIGKKTKHENKTNERKYGIKKNKQLHYLCIDIFKALFMYNTFWAFLRKTKQENKVVVNEMKYLRKFSVFSVCIRESVCLYMVWTIFKMF